MILISDSLLFASLTDHGRQASTLSPQRSDDVNPWAERAIVEPHVVHPRVGRAGYSNGRARAIPLRIFRLCAENADADGTDLAVS